jgi:hypothetical protein
MRMKTAILFSLPITTSAAGVCWRWRSVDGRADSTRSFSEYADCLENAWANGYCVERTPQRARNLLFRAREALTLRRPLFRAEKPEPR